MSKKGRDPEDKLNSNVQIDDEEYWLDDEIDEDDEDYYLDEEIEEDEEGYWLDEEDPDFDIEEAADAEADAADTSGPEEAQDPEEAGGSEEFGEEESDGFEEEYEEAQDPQEEEPENEDVQDPDDEDDGEAEDKLPKKKRLKKVGIIIGSIVGVLAVAYIGVSVYFMSHFYVNTEINGHNFSAKTTADVEEYMKEQVKNYTLTIQEKESRSDTIAGDEIDLVYEANDDIKNALKKQNAFLWPSAFFQGNSTKVTIEVSYDAEKLEAKIQTLQPVTIEQIPAENAYPKFDGEQFVVEPEVTGTAVDLEVLSEKINQYITEFQPELDMVEEGCYALPKYTSESPEVQAACDEMNKYLQASITYTMDENVVVDKTLISQWVTADAELKVTFNEEAVRQWLSEFGDRYDTVAAARTITTPTGKTTEVSGGTYGWGIDEETEFAALVNSIKNGEVVTKEPAYYIGQTAASHGPQDWGSTYVEVDLSAQHMWYIVDGAVVFECDVVTGLPTADRATPSGVYTILEKTLNKTLVGDINPSTGKPEYETPVSYWMRVTWSGVGFHDATWQPGFGGDLYTYLGSHGCINMSYSTAATLYDLVSVGDPVIMHY